MSGGTTSAASAPIVSANPQRVVIAQNFHSSWVSQSENVRLSGDATTTLTVRFRNTGTASWVRGVLGEQAALGISGDGASLSMNWPAADRVALQNEEVVPPAGIGTFTFDVRAPLAAGSYRLDLRPVVDGTTWMEDEGVFFTVTSQGIDVANQALGKFYEYAYILIYAGSAVLLLLVLMLIARALARLRHSTSATMMGR